jgi:hypothetical protein
MKHHRVGAGRIRFSPGQKTQDDSPKKGEGDYVVFFGGGAGRGGWGGEARWRRTPVRRYAGEPMAFAFLTLHRQHRAAVRFLKKEAMIFLLL